MKCIRNSYLNKLFHIPYFIVYTVNIFGLLIIMWFIDNLFRGYGSFLWSSCLLKSSIKGCDMALPFYAVSDVVQ